MHFYENLFDSLFIFFRNVLAMLGLVFALGLVLDVRRGDFGPSAFRSWLQPTSDRAGDPALSSDAMAQEVRHARAHARAVLDR